MSKVGCSHTGFRWIVQASPNYITPLNLNTITNFRICWIHSCLWHIPCSCKPNCTAYTRAYHSDQQLDAGLNEHCIDNTYMRMHFIKLTSRCFGGIHFCLLLHCAAYSLDSSAGLVVLNDTTFSHSLSGLAQDRAKESCKLGGITLGIPLDVLFVVSRLAMLQEASAATCVMQCNTMRIALLISILSILLVQHCV